MLSNISIIPVVGRSSACHGRLGSMWLTDGRLARWHPGTPAINPWWVYQCFYLRKTAGFIIWFKSSSDYFCVGEYQFLNWELFLVILLMISGSIYIHDRVGDWETLKLTQHNLLFAINRIEDLIDVDGVVPAIFSLNSCHRSGDRTKWIIIWWTIVSINSWCYVPKKNYISSKHKISQSQALKALEMIENSLFYIVNIKYCGSPCT